MSILARIAVSTSRSRQVARNPCHRGQTRLARDWCQRGQTPGREGVAGAAPLVRYAPATVRRIRRDGPPTPDRVIGHPAPGGEGVSLPPWARLVVVVAGAKAALGLVLYLSLGELRATPAVPVWVYAALTAAFAAVGGTLVAGNRRDPRAAWLGGLLLLIASALAPVVNRVAGDVPLAAVVRPDAFLPAFIWMFVREFPSPLAAPGAVGSSTASRRRARRRRAVRRRQPLACRLAGRRRRRLADAAAEGDGGGRLVLAARVRRSAYWRFRCCCGGPAPQPPTNARACGSSCAAWLGLTPFALEVVAEGLFPAYSRVHLARAGPRRWSARCSSALLATVPFVTAYSVLFDRVMQVRVVLRAALQHMLARYDHRHARRHARSRRWRSSSTPSGPAARLALCRAAAAAAAGRGGARPGRAQDAPPLARRHRPPLLP